MRSPSGHHTAQPPVSVSRRRPVPSGWTMKTPLEKLRLGLKLIHCPFGDHRGTEPGVSITRRASPVPSAGATQTREILFSVREKTIERPSGDTSPYASLPALVEVAGRAGPPLVGTRQILRGSVPQVLKRTEAPSGAKRG